MGEIVANGTLVPARPISVRRAFTVIELLVATGIVAVLAAIVATVALRARSSADRAACLAHMKQAGTALTLYVADADERTPAAPSGFLGGKVAFGTGWAGRVAGYATNPDVFRCRADGRELPRPGLSLPGSQIVSYGINANLTPESGVTSAVASARTVLLFEVSGGRALLSSPDEGATMRPGTYRLLSPEGTGTYGSILEGNRPYPGPLPARFTLYATGVMDNAEGDNAGSDDFDAPRHGGGANVLALDLHAAWARPGQVSAGNTANASENPQSRSGCHVPFSARDLSYQCAEGTAHAGHRFTFSPK